jgi:hypothetical protein
VVIFKVVAVVAVSMVMRGMARLAVQEVEPVVVAVAVAGETFLARAVLVVLAVLATQ